MFSRLERSERGNRPGRHARFGPCRRPAARCSPILYQLNMMAAYLEYGLTDTAVFELFVRNLPPRRGFLMAAGLDQALQFLETVAFTPEDLAALRDLGQFSEGFLSYLGSFRFVGDVDAMPEGTVFFADEPIIRVTARCPRRSLSKPGSSICSTSRPSSRQRRREWCSPHPARRLSITVCGGRMAPRPVCLRRGRAISPGFSGTATIAAGVEFGIPLYGTMAHSFIQAHDDEMLAFEHFARSHPQGLVLLIDTYDTERAANRVVALAPRLLAQGIIDCGRAHRQRQPRRARAQGSPDPRRRAGSATSKSSPAAVLTRTCSWLCRGPGPDRLLRHRHQPDHRLGRTGARLRLQAARICRAPAAQTLGGESDLARPQTGMASL